MDTSKLHVFDIGKERYSNFEKLDHPLDPAHVMAQFTRLNETGGTRVLMLNSRDALLFKTHEKFVTFTDIDYIAEAFDRGYLGRFLHLDVYTDGVFKRDEQFMAESGFMRLTN